MEERETQMGTKDIILIPVCFINGNRNGNNVCAIPGGLDHRGTVTAALWADTGSTDTVYSACAYILLWLPLTGDFKASGYHPCYSLTP